MSRTIYTLLLLLCAQTSPGQKGNIYINQVKFSPVRMIDPVNPGIEICYERAHGSKFSSQISAGYMREFVDILPFYNYGGFRLAFDEKYFFSGLPAQREYLSAEVVYLNVGYGDWADLSYSGPTTNSPTIHYSDDIHVKKQTIALNFKIGESIAWERVVFDIAAGFGIKYRSVNRTGINPTTATEVHDPFDASSGITFNLPFTFKIGYAF